ncbi:MAG: LysR family transcriptional regulator, partial [Methanocella sp.]
MDLRQLQTLRTVATTLNFTQAAAALGYVQSSVTAQIQALETELGVRLFDRLGRRVVLTDAGARLLKYADRMLALAEEARVAAAGAVEPAGSLTLSAPETVCTYRLPAVLHRFRALHPQVQLVFRPSLVRDLRRGVREGALDVAFLLERPVQGEGLNVVRLRGEEMLVVAPPGHRLAALPAVRAADLAGEQVLFTELGCSYRNQFEHALIQAGVYPSTALEFGSIESIKQCVMAGMGIALLPAVSVAREVEEKRGGAPKRGGPPHPKVTAMVWAKG